LASPPRLFLIDSFGMLRKLAKSYSPEYIAAVFESGAPVQRMAEFAEYKSNRAEMPPDLGEQIPYVRRILAAMRIPILEYPGFEADANRLRAHLHVESRQGRRLVRSGQGQGVSGRETSSRLAPRIVERPYGRTRAEATEVLSGGVLPCTHRSLYLTLGNAGSMWLD
jgi:5'-3' exonuclease, N-terminal resolvase-like domain